MVTVEESIRINTIWINAFGSNGSPRIEPTPIDISESQNDAMRSLTQDDADSIHRKSWLGESLARLSDVHGISEMHVDEIRGDFFKFEEDIEEDDKRILSANRFQLGLFTKRKWGHQRFSTKKQRAAKDKNAKRPGGDLLRREVLEISHALSSGQSVKAISKKWCVCPRSVLRIENGKSWGRLTGR